MQSFRAEQRVKIVDAAHQLKGKTGTVDRVRTDGKAWVNMDEPLPADIRSFQPPDPRAQYLVLFPDQCEAAEG
jgi:hypothetical protein